MLNLTEANLDLTDAETVDCHPCDCCGASVPEDEALGCPETEYLCEGCFHTSVLHDNGFFGDSAAEPVVEPTGDALEAAVAALRTA